MTREYVYWVMVGMLLGLLLAATYAFGPWFTGPANAGFPTWMGG